MAKKKKGTHHPYEELKRWLSAFNLFCGTVAIIGMAASGSRVITIVCSAGAVILSLMLATRIIIWGLSSAENVKRGAQEAKRDS